MADPLVEFLSDPANYPEGPARIVHYETHISHVFVGDRYAYKIKKPVDMGFLDFTTLARRRFYCRREVELNRRLAKGIYLGVTPLFRSPAGYSFSSRGAAAVAEYAVRMRRIPEERILFSLVGRGALLEGEMAAVARMLARFHRSAPSKGSSAALLRAVRKNTEEDFLQLKPFAGRTVGREQLAELASYTRAFIDGYAHLFRGRAAAGLVRDVHGDLHSQHICLARRPFAFDCIEFNDRFRITDIVDDIAFLLMDIEYEGRFDLAAELAAVYFDALPAARNDELLRFYKVYRATVRGKIESFIASSVADRAERARAFKMASDYFDLAHHYITRPAAPFNPLVFMGPSGSGKSRLAEAVAGDGVLIRSDDLRKGLAGVKKTDHTYVKFGKGIYTAACTERTYETMLAEGIAAARQGRRVVLDATYLLASQRRRVLTESLRRGLNPFFVFCTAPTEVLLRRVEERRRRGTDVSDAHAAVVRRQLALLEQPAELPSFRVCRLNTDAPVASLAAALRRLPA